MSVDLPEQAAGSLQEFFVHSDDKDWFLQSVIKLVNAGMEIGVTLTLPGSIVSGTLISGHSYFVEISELLRSTSSPKNEKKNFLLGVADLWEKNASIYEDDASEQMNTTIGYIHLRDAYFYSPSGDRLPTGKVGTLWRGRLAAVSGFCVGVISID